MVNREGKIQIRNTRTFIVMYIPSTSIVVVCNDIKIQHATNEIHSIIQAKK